METSDQLKSKSTVVSSDIQKKIFPPKKIPEPFTSSFS